MDIWSEIQNLIEQNEAKFISFKYTNIAGRLYHIDISTNNFFHENGYISVNGLKLKPIQNKYFLDPFRSIPTIFCLCEIAGKDFNIRNDIKSLLDKQEDIATEIALEFIIKDAREELVINPIHQVEPNDKLVNLRSEILDILENIGIKTLYHSMGNNAIQLIAIRSKDVLDTGDNFLILNYIIANVAVSYGKQAILQNDISKLVDEENIKLNLIIDLNGNNFRSLENYATMFEQKQQDIKLVLNLPGTQHFAVFKDKGIRITFPLYLINPYIILGLIIKYGLSEKMNSEDANRILERYSLSLKRF